MVKRHGPCVCMTQGWLSLSGQGSCRGFSCGGGRFSSPSDTLNHTEGPACSSTNPADSWG